MNSFFLSALADTACCAAICLCCVWCLKTKGTRLRRWMIVLLAVITIPAAFWALQSNYLTGVYGIRLIPHRMFKTVSLPEFLVQASEKGVLSHILAKLGSLVAAVLAPIAILLYQKKDHK